MICNSYESLLSILLKKLCLDKFTYSFSHSLTYSSNTSVIFKIIDLFDLIHNKDAKNYTALKFWNIEQKGYLGL